MFSSEALEAFNIFVNAATAVGAIKLFQPVFYRWSNANVVVDSMLPCFEPIIWHVMSRKVLSGNLVPKSSKYGVGYISLPHCPLPGNWTAWSLAR